MRVARQRRLAVLVGAGLLLIATAASFRQRIVAFGALVGSIGRSRAVAHPQGSSSDPSTRPDRAAAGDVFMQISDEYLGHEPEAPVAKTELAALYWCATQAPEVEVGRRSMMRLNVLISTVDLTELSTAIEWAGAPSSCDLRPIGSGLLSRVRAEPKHPQAARLLAVVCGMTRENHDSSEPTAVFAAAADLIASTYAKSPDIGGFLDCFAAEEDAPRWTSRFDTHVDTILEASPHASIRCRALFALACLARNSGGDGDARASDLLRRMLKEFDGPEAPAIDESLKPVLERARAMRDDLTVAHVDTTPVVALVDVENHEVRVSKGAEGRLLLALSTKPGNVILDAELPVALIDQRIARLAAMGDRFSNWRAGDRSDLCERGQCDDANAETVRVIDLRSLETLDVAIDSIIEQFESDWSTP